MIPESELVIKPPYTPELLSAVQEDVAAFLRTLPTERPPRPPRVLEFGAGWSTVWFAQLGADVVSVEHSGRWFAEVARALARLYLRADLRLVAPDDFPAQAAEFPDGHFSLVLVDCIDGQRLPCVAASLSKLRPGGLLVLDDSHWDMLRPAFDLLTGWDRWAQSGMHTRKTGEVKYHQTTIFVRP